MLYIYFWLRVCNNGNYFVQRCEKLGIWLGYGIRVGYQYSEQ